jgi:UbiD family decarboxylase
MKRAIALLEKHNLLKIISDELDINLEIPHIAYVEVKKADSKAILFTNVVDRKNGKKFKEPVLMNVCSRIAYEPMIVYFVKNNTRNHIISNSRGM